MPKKHAPSYTHTKPSYVHPSLQSSRSASSSAPAEPQTVTQRIQQLRREQTPRASSSRRDEVTEIVSSRTLPKQVRQVLHMAEVDSPPPKPGNRTSRAPRRGGARPPPGPAAPSSWLQTSRHAPPHIRNLKKYRTGGDMGPARFCALAQVHDAEYKRLPPPRSLVHHCLKTLASHWEDLVEYEQHYLHELPVPLKEALLSYLTIYGARDCLDMRSLKTLFSNNPEGEGHNGAEDIRFLDLTGLLSQNYTLNDLNKCLARPIPIAPVTSDFSSLSLEDLGRASPTSSLVAESWEDEADTPSTTPIPSTLTIPHFPNLTRLSLAHPGTSASWPALLSLSSNLKTLTHLSLAYWPIPSMTPNATTTSMVSKHGGAVALGGSHFYSELDGDWHEAANILRRLSKNTYCLQWLDLEGCAWIQALTWEPEDTSSSTTRRTTRARGLGHAALADSGNRRRADAAWEASAAHVGPDWNGAWRQVEYINMFQGWMPRDVQRVQSMPAGYVNVQLLSWLREHGDDEAYADKWGDGSVSDWVEREKGCRSTGVEILRRRRKWEGRWVCVDHGWEVGVRVRRGDGEGEDE